MSRLTPRMVLVLTAAVCLAAGAALAADAPAKPPAEAEKGPQPKFNPPGGVFAKPISLRLTVPEAGAVVRFTLDGSDPTEKAEAFREDLRLTATTLLKARVFKGTQPAGPTVSQT
ncbi:MAG TPA: chitobiase/beta-hexosaminidase C-terminal domain-containing protein, partial [Candidatus Saccharimonadales bacterium]|nr:chitobiase/beta-hexosaminidase C-terminal domain-containing protein [Candidatus Saccharimonadales bacterium]